MNKLLTKLAPVLMTGVLMCGVQISVANAQEQAKQGAQGDEGEQGKQEEQARAQDNLQVVYKSDAWYGNTRTKGKAQTLRCYRG